MINGTKGIILDCMQLKRIAEHPIQLKENLIINDNLESGTLRIYEATGGSLNIQQLYTGYGDVSGAVLVLEATINDVFKDESVNNSFKWKEGVFIHKIFCEYGYESLIQPVINQILHFAGFYMSHPLVKILDREYEKWVYYSPKVFAGFQRINRIYECQL